MNFLFTSPGFISEELY